MIEQKIVWTALPNGMRVSEEGRKQLQVSVFVSPRLHTDEGLPEPKLKTFPDFAGNWPQKVSQLSFKVKLHDGTVVPAKLDTSKLDPGLWNRLFHEETYVRPHQFTDLSGKAIRSYPICGVMAYLKEKYLKIAENSPGKLPLLVPERDDDGKPMGDPDATLAGFMEDMGELLTPEKEILCEITGEQYLVFKHAMKEEKGADESTLQGHYYVLAYIQACLNKHKLTLSSAAKIVLVNEFIWKIIDGDSEYFVEDTGSAIIVYKYGDIYQDIDQILKINKVLDPNKLYGFKQSELDFLQANRFYDRKEEKGEFHLKPNAQHVPPSPDIEKMDFHQMLAMLGDHPLLMRKLGIVLDLRFAPPLQQAIKSVKVIPKWPAANQPPPFHADRSPVTSCYVKDDQFMAQPKPMGDIVDGMLNLQGADDEWIGASANFHLMQVDPEGSALKLLRAGSSMVRQLKRKYQGTFPQTLAKKMLKNGCELDLHALQSLYAEVLDDPEPLSSHAKISAVGANRWVVTEPGKQLEIVKTPKETLHLYEKKTTAFDTPDDAGLPSLRTAGIGVFKAGRAYALHDKLQANLKMDGKLQANADIHLYADDLLRGYRVDVLDENHPGPVQWRSLCRRIGNYYVGEDALDPSTAENPLAVDDEGYVKGTSTTSGDAQASDLYLNETLFRWDGWSLVAQRPGKTIAPVTGETEVYLFNWNDIPIDNQELIAFLKKTLHARWVEKATIQKPAADKITVSSASRFLALVRTNQKVTLSTDNGRQYHYSLKDESGDRNVYTAIPKQDETPAAIVNKAQTEFELANRFAAKPGSLPRLRFGHRYRIRARTVDIAGNSLPHPSGNASAASEPILFARFEPLLPPTLVPRRAFTEGEAAEHLVIRSNFDHTAGQYIASQDVVDALVGAAHTYEVANERHVVPPKTSQLMAETHGEFDDYFGLGQNHAQGYNIALKEAGTLEDKAIVNPQTGQKEPLPNPEDVEVIPNPKPGDPKEGVPGQYIIHKEAQLLLPYLPDPIARGVVLQEVPGMTASGTPALEKVIDPVLGLDLLKVPFELKWPEAFPFRIRLAERPGTMEARQCDQSFENLDEPPSWDANQRLLTIYLGKAEVRKIRYSGYFHETDLARMGVWKWLRKSSHLQTLKKYSLSGKHWMMTPFRTVTLVHAVQQPLCEPTISSLVGIKRQIGDTMAEIQGEITLSAKSTDKVHLRAHWTEPVDDPQQPAPTTRDVHANAFELKIDYDADNDMAFPLTPCVAHLHEFGDTKYRYVQYYLTGASRFREYFHPAISATAENPSDATLEYCFDWNSIPGTDAQVLLDFLKHIRLVDNTANAGLSKSTDGKVITVTEEGQGLDLQRNSDQNGLEIQLSDSRKYVFDLTMNNAAKCCLRTDKISRQGPILEAEIFSSARPLAPKVQYILPTFGWEQETDDGSDTDWKRLKRTRKGGGLRVYLERPWFSSGDGELLGVTLYPHLVPDKLKPYVTQWGMDPIRKSKVPKGGLNVGDFENVAHSQTNLSLAEIAGPKVHVAGFAVEYNSDRKLWYSDIEVDAAIMTSYYPFIRLALTRYQPKSIANAHLSPVVLTDFVQMANDRTLEIKRKRRKRQVEIRLTGRATGDRASNRVEVALEMLPPGENPDFGWVQTKGSRAQPNPYRLQLVPVEASTYLWRWEGTLKLPRLLSDNAYRLVIREFEKFDADTNLDNMGFFSVSAAPHHFVKESERLVYVDMVTL